MNIFEHLQKYMTSTMSIEDYQYDNNILDRSLSKFLIKVIKEVGSTTNINNFKTYEEYKSHVLAIRKKKRELELVKFHEWNPLRMQFTETTDDKLEAIISVIEDFYDKKVFKKSNVDTAMILTSDKTMGNLKIGIALKQSPYSNHYTMYVYGIVGAYCDDISPSGNHDAFLLSGSYSFGVYKVYDGFPEGNYKDIQNDFLLEYMYGDKLPTKCYMSDNKEYKIFPTYLDYKDTLLKMPTWTCDGNGTVEDFEKIKI